MTPRTLSPRSLPVSPTKGTRNKSCGYAVRWLLALTGAAAFVSVAVTAFQLLGHDVEQAYDRRLNTIYSTPPQNEKGKPNGVFVMKVMRAEHAARTICLLNRFFLSTDPKHQYPIRIFADYDYTNETMNMLKTHANGADLEIIVDTVSWTKLPPTLNETERVDILRHCTNFDQPEIALCSEYVAGLAYIYMGYWRFMRMADEPALQHYEYFVSIDADAYLTAPMADPFEIMAENNLTGVFDVELFQFKQIARGVQEAAESVFTLEERQHRYLDSPKYQVFDKDGKWHRDGQDHPSVWGFFFGGRLDFFRSSRYREFARRVVPYTYTYRTDEQGVVAVAWSLLADNDKVWYLPQHDYSMGVYHQGFVDNSQVVKLPHRKANHVRKENQTYALNTLDLWSNYKREDARHLLSWVDYVESKGYNKDGDTWKTCVDTCTKHCNPWVDPRTMSSTKKK